MASLLVDVVVVLVVAGEGDERADAQAVREEDLRGGVDPNLWRRAAPKKKQIITKEKKT